MNGSRTMETMWRMWIVAVLALALAACAKSSDGKPGDRCGEHGHLGAGTSCLCDPGYYDNGLTCVLLVDGDSSESDSDADADTTVLDGDNEVDADKDEAADTDSDSDPDPDQTACACPNVQGVFCLDPEVANPQDYTQIEVTPSGCELRVSVRTSRQVVFFGTVACDTQARATLASLGCVLSYEASGATLKLFCDPSLYPFSAAYCAHVDGDETDEVETDGIDATDPDPIESETEVTEPDEPWCTDDENCAAYFFCESGSCKAGCNPSNPCADGFTCSPHGLCIPGGGDPDEGDEEVGGCASNESCAWGSYCKIPAGAASGECVIECAADLACPNNQACIEAEGRCVADGTPCPAGDSNCLAGWLCNDSQLCVVGCYIGDGTCAACETCDGHRCRRDSSCGTSCTTADECVAAHGADYFCNQSGACEKLVIECTDDYSAFMNCGSYHYCRDQACVQDCSLTIPCQLAGASCTIFGRCEVPDIDPEPEADSDSDFEYECWSDGDCPAGKYCSTAKTCLSGCTSNGPFCDDGYVCDGHGRCNPSGTTGPIYCRNGLDSDCPSKMFCDLSEHKCVNGCTSCECNQLCNDHGRCVACVLGDAGCNICADGDPDVDTTCTTLADCPDYYYCGGNGTCQTECLPSCALGKVCSETTRRCVDGCRSDNNCPSDKFCRYDTLQCSQECTTDLDCTPGFSCTSRHQCKPLRTPCASDANCPRYTHCVVSAGICDSDCQMNSISCDEGRVCDTRGTCTTTPGSYTFTACTNDTNCPILSYCSGAEGICTADCMTPNVACQNGEFCNLHGKCEPLVPEDGDVDETDDDTDPADGDSTDSDGESTSSDAPFLCSSNCDCPNHTDCLTLFGYCSHVNCLNDANCPTGQTCGADGRCAVGPTSLDLNCVLRCKSGAPNCPCQSDDDCPDYSYCDANGHYCTLDCISLPGVVDISCLTGETCTAKGRCVAK